MRESLGEVWRYRELLQILVGRDLRVRYKNSVLGFGWSLINPLVQVAVLAAVLVFLVDPKNRPANYHAYVFCATLPWLFFNTALMDGAASLVNYHQLIRRTYFPRELIPLSSVLANLVHLALSLAAFLLYMLLNAGFWFLAGRGFQWPVLPTALLLPIPIVGLVLLVGGWNFFLSVFTLYFEDVRFLTDSVLKVAYWLVPVVYFSEQILLADPMGMGRTLYVLYMLNPLAAFITAFRKLVLVPTKMLGTQTPSPPMTEGDWLFLGIGLVTSAGFFLLGFCYFNTKKWRLAERG